VNITDEHGNTLYRNHGCTHARPRWDLFELLLARGAPYDVNLAYVKGDIDKVRSLLAADAGAVHFQAPYMKRPLSCAASAAGATASRCYWPPGRQVYFCADGTHRRLRELRFVRKTVSQTVRDDGTVCKTVLRRWCFLLDLGIPRRFRGTLPQFLHLLPQILPVGALGSRQAAQSFRAAHAGEIGVL
jgi:hypothetical protein